MPIGQTTGVRSLQDLKYLQAFIAATVQNRFIAEAAGSLTGDNLFKVASDLDKVAAENQNATWRQEHTDAYCLARDFRYGRRSRKWLMAKALATDFDHAYNLWMSFVTENWVTNQATIAPLLKQEANYLADLPFDKVLKP